MAGWVSFSPDAFHPGADPRLAGGRLTIDLDALAANYRLLADRAAPARIAGVVKADGYGLGAERVATALWQAGCRTFFVALPEEGVALRAALPSADIYVLSGPLGPEAAPAFGEHRLLPVLNSQTDISTWEAFGWDGERPRPCAIHIDTGMNRLGLTPAEASAFAEENALTGAITPLLVMSHLACADQPEHPKNRRQLESFQAARRVFAEVEASLSNSAGIFLGPDFALDLTRPGIALYGGNPVTGMANPMRPVARLEARVLYVRHAQPGDTVSYGATRSLDRDTVVAVAAVGYADGFHRASSGSGVPLRNARPQGGCGFIAGRRVPILGRVTMDLTMFDVTDLGPDAVKAGDWIELFGPNIPLDEAAGAAGTIAYEMLTSLGRRFERRYVGGEYAHG